MTRIRQKNTYGLATQQNSLAVPDGATERLLNVLHQRDGLYIKERGFLELYDPNETIYGCFEFDEYIVVVLNSKIIRIDKFGATAGSKTSSDEPFEIDGTLRPAPYAFTGAPFSLIANDQAFFCTPEGIRVMRQSSSNSSSLPGLDAPTIDHTADLTVSADNFVDAEGTLNLRVQGSVYLSKQSFYNNDLVLNLAKKSASPPQNFDVEADSAISYKAVLRRVLPNGQTIESEPSQPVFAYNPVMDNIFWETDNPNTYGFNLGPNEIIVWFYYLLGSGSPAPIIPTRFTAGEIYSGTIRNFNCVRQDSGTTVETIPQPDLEGRYDFTVLSATTFSRVTGGITFLYDFVRFKVVLPNSPRVDENANAPYANDSKGFLSFQLDRYSNIEIKVPSSAKTGDFIDLYYSKTEVPLSSNPLAIPDGDYYLAKEIEITGAGSPGWTITTNFSDGIFQKGLPLYTNPSDGDRTRQPNLIPPGANCIENWKGYTFYGNTYRRHQLDLTHIGGNLSTNRTFSIQFTDSGTPENYTFQFIQTTADAATIKKRTMELAAAVTATSSNFLVYFSGGNIEFPGGITVISRIPNRGFKVFVSNSDLGNSMEPVVGTTFNATTAVSKQEAKRNRIYWSKLNQPEAVPYFVDVGSEDEDILNIKRVREALIVIKRDGIFSLFGDPGSGVLSVREIDTTIKGITSTGVARLGNRVYTKTNQGIVAISETGINLVSRKQIEPLVKISDESSTGDTVMYALEDDRQLYVATATSPTDSTKTVYSYNAITQSWSEISKVFTWGFVVDNNFTPSKLFQNNRVITDGSKIFLERKDYLLTDFADQSYNFTVAAISTDKLTITLSGAYTGSVGSTLAWDNGTDIKLYRITAVDGADVTLASPFSGAVTNPVVIYSPILSIIRTSPIDGGDSSIVKQFTKFIINTRYDALSVATLAFRNDWFKNGPEIEWTKRDERRGWGQEQWGRFPWGQVVGRTLEYLTAPSQIIQTEIPRILQKSTFLQAEISHNVACEGMFIQQLAFEVDTKDMRPAR